MTPQERIERILPALEAEYPDADCTLEERDPWKLLVQVRLAAQCTDERVNQITPALFARFPTLESFAEADVEEVERYVHSCGFFRAKARDIVACAQVLLEQHGGKVPATMEVPKKKLPRLSKPSWEIAESTSISVAIWVPPHGFLSGKGYHGAKSLSSRRDEGARGFGRRQVLRCRFPIPRPLKGDLLKNLNNP